MLRNVSPATFISPYKVSSFVTQHVFLSASLLPSNHVLCFCSEDKPPTLIGQKISWETPESRGRFYSFDINRDLTPCCVCLFICFTSQNTARKRKQKSSIQKSLVFVAVCSSGLLPSDSPDLLVPDSLLMQPVFSLWKVSSFGQKWRNTKGEMKEEIFSARVTQLPVSAQEISGWATGCRFLFIQIITTSEKHTTQTADEWDHLHKHTGGGQNNRNAGLMR